MQFFQHPWVGAIVFTLTLGCRHPSGPPSQVFIVCSSMPIAASDTTSAGGHVFRLQSFCRDSLGRPVPVPGDSTVKSHRAGV